MRKSLRVYGVLVGLMFTLPLGYIAFKTIEQLRSGESQNSIAELFNDLINPLINSLTLATTVAATTAFIGTTLAWIINSSNIRLKRLLSILVVLPIVLPSFVSAAAFISSFSNQGMIGSVLVDLGIDPPKFQGFWAAWFVLTLVTYPYVYITVKARLSAQRMNLEESAQLLGRNPFNAFVNTTLPQLKPAIISGSLIVFLYCLSDFGAVQLLRYDTLTRVIYETIIADRSASMFSMIFLALTAGVVVAIERSLGSNSSQDTKTEVGRHRSMPLGKFRTPVSIYVWFTIFVGFFAPIAGLTLWATRALSSVNFNWADVTSSISSTALAGTSAAVITILVILPVAMTTLYSKSYAARFTGITVLSGYSTPGVLIALALAFWSLNTPGAAWVYQSFGVLLLGYLIHFGSLALGSTETALKAVPQSLKDSAKMLSKTTPERWWKVHLPLMQPGLLSGAGLVMLATVKELPVTLLLAPTGFSTLATDIWSAFDERFFARTGVLSLILIAVSTLLSWPLILKRYKLNS